MRLWNTLIAAALFIPTFAQAHVKWFSDFRYDQPPVSFSSLDHPSFWGLLALSVVTIIAFSIADRWLENWAAFRDLNRRLEAHSTKATVILRIFTGASLLLAWQADSMVAPELKITSQAAGWYQFGLALLLLGRKTTPFAGAGMIGLYAYAMTQYGFFHLLDYLVYLGIGIFFLVSEAANGSVRATRVPALFIGLGFSLCWAALEKIFYPGWGLQVLEQAPALTMGLAPTFFLLACAFVEFSLGYLLLIGLLSRPLAMTITLTFFTTTAFFGKTEVVGHTLLHGALLVFIVLGTGNHYRAPIAIHRDLRLRATFAGVNFLILLLVLGFSYRAIAQRTYESSTLVKPALLDSATQ